jgi:pantetheine-phosphate adenylyltransferase
MKKIAVFPGSFDPFTNGHKSIVIRSLPLFDRVFIAIGYNQEKKGYYPLEKRLGWIKDVFKDEDKVYVDHYTGLTVDYCKKKNANYILRGLRTAADFEYERGIAQINKIINPKLETVFLLTTPELTPITSTIIQDIIRNGGDASQFVPKEVRI